MNLHLRSLTLAAAIAATLFSGPAAAGGKPWTVFGLTDDQRLVRFDADDADDVDVVGAIVLDGNDVSLVGIDFRVQDGELYGVGNLGGLGDKLQNGKLDGKIICPPASCRNSRPICHRPPRRRSSRSLLREPARPLPATRARVRS